MRKKIIKEYHQILKRGTTDERKDWFKVGEYKKLANEVGRIKTVPPSKVKEEIKDLFGITI